MVYYAVSDNVGTISQFTGRKKINIDSSPDGALTAFQVGNGEDVLTITYETKMLYNFNDIRFTETDGTHIPYFVFPDSIVLSTSCDVRFKTDVPAAGGKYIYMYYGNSSLHSGSNGDDVFELYDEFDGSGYRHPDNPILEIDQPWEQYYLDTFDIIEDPLGRTKYIMWYDSKDGTTEVDFKIGVATSDDGVNWTKYVNNPILSHQYGVGDMSVIYESDIFKMWTWSEGPTQDINDNLLYFTSVDGYSWTEHGSSPLLSGVPYIGWSVSKFDSTYYLIGQNKNDSKLHVFDSPDGITWTHRGDTGLSGEISTVYKHNSKYYMYYHYITTNEIALAESNDMLSWTDKGIVLHRSSTGWDSHFVADPMIMNVNGQFWIYYKGSAGNPTSDGKYGIFVLTHPFENVALDLTKWTGTYSSVVNGILKLINGNAVTSLLNLSVDTIFESRWKATNSGSGACVVGYNSYTDAEHAALQIYQSAHDLYTRVGTGGASNADNRKPLSSAFRSMQIDRRSTTDAYYTDGVDVYSYNTNIPIGDIPIKIFTRPGYSETLEIDWVIVRTYTANPPIVTVGAEEVSVVKKSGRPPRRSTGASLEGGTSCGMGRRRR